MSKRGEGVLLYPTHTEVTVGVSEAWTSPPDSRTCLDGIFLNFKR
jgi:hypothetical protein